MQTINVERLKDSKLSRVALITQNFKMIAVDGTTHHISVLTMTADIRLRRRSKPSTSSYTNPLVLSLPGLETTSGTADVGRGARHLTLVTIHQTRAEKKRNTVLVSKQRTDGQLIHQNNIQVNVRKKLFTQKCNFTFHFFRLLLKKIHGQVNLLRLNGRDVYRGMQLGINKVLYK